MKRARNNIFYFKTNLDSLKNQSALQETSKKSGSNLEVGKGTRQQVGSSDAQDNSDDEKIDPDDQAAVKKEESQKSKETKPNVPTHRRTETECTTSGEACIPMDNVLKVFPDIMDVEHLDSKEHVVITKHESMVSVAADDMQRVKTIMDEPVSPPTHDRRLASTDLFEVGQGCMGVGSAGFSIVGAVAFYLARRWMKRRQQKDVEFEIDIELPQFTNSNCAGSGTFRRRSPK